MQKPNETLINSEEMPFVITAITCQINRFDKDIPHSEGWQRMRRNCVDMLQRTLAVYAPNDDINDYLIQPQEQYQ